MMTNQPANHDALISIALGAIVTVVAAASVINLLFPNPTFMPLSIDSTIEPTQVATSNADR